MVIMDRAHVFAEVEIKHERRTSAVRRTITTSPDSLSARDRLAAGVSALPGVSNDPDTVADIMSFIDAYLGRTRELNGQTSGS